MVAKKDHLWENWSIWCFLVVARAYELLQGNTKCSSVLSILSWVVFAIALGSCKVLRLQNDRCFGSLAQSRGFFPKKIMRVGAFGGGGFWADAMGRGLGQDREGNQSMPLMLFWNQSKNILKGLRERNLHDLLWELSPKHLAP